MNLPNFTIFYIILRNFRVFNAKTGVRKAGISAAKITKTRKLVVFRNADKFLRKNDSFCGNFICGF